jgi:hypothetical protein
MEILNGVGVNGVVDSVESTQGVKIGRNRYLKASCFNL